MNLNHTQAKHRPTTSTDPLTLTLNEVNADMLPLVGGKAANLGELHRAGLSIPEGFCITTTAYERVSFQTRLESILSELATTDPEDTQQWSRMQPPRAQPSQALRCLRMS